MIWYDRRTNDARDEDWDSDVDVARFHIDSRKVMAPRHWCDTKSSGAPRWYWIMVSFGHRRSDDEGPAAQWPAGLAAHHGGNRRRIMVVSHCRMRHTIWRRNHGWLMDYDIEFWGSIWLWLMDMRIRHEIIGLYLAWVKYRYILYNLLYGEQPLI